jgi:hypothetical protein
LLSPEGFSDPDVSTESAHGPKKRPSTTSCIKRLKKETTENGSGFLEFYDPLGSKVINLHRFLSYTFRNFRRWNLNSNSNQSNRQFYLPKLCNNQCQ